MYLLSGLYSVSSAGLSKYPKKENENTQNDYRLEDRIIRTHYQLKESARYSLNTVHGYGSYETMIDTSCNHNKINLPPGVRRR
mgnify:CR=1 FL=1